MVKFRVKGINRHRMYIDGKGINTLVALDGCPLKCKYCINKKMLEKRRFTEITPEELVEKVLIDYCYFVTTGGGITFGGGEALLYSEQISCFRKVLPEDIPIKVETCLNISQGHLLEVMDVVDEYIIDIKTMNPQVYEEYTGMKNLWVLDNLEFLCEKGLQDKCKIRIPNIPNFTTKEDIDEAVDIIEKMGFKNIEIFDYIIEKAEERNE